MASTVAARRPEFTRLTLVGMAALALGAGVLIGRTWIGQEPFTQDGPARTAQGERTSPVEIGLGRAAYAKVTSTVDLGLGRAAFSEVGSPSTVQIEAVRAASYAGSSPSTIELGLGRAAFSEVGSPSTVQIEAVRAANWEFEGPTVRMGKELAKIR